MSQSSYGLWADVRARSQSVLRVIRYWKAGAREWGRFWWHRSRAWRPGQAIGAWVAYLRERGGSRREDLRSWAADVPARLLQIRPRSLGLWAGLILLCSMMLVGVLQSGGGSASSALGDAFTVEVDENGQSYVALDPDAVGESTSTRAEGGGGGDRSSRLFAIVQSGSAISLVPVDGSAGGLSQPPPGPGPGPGPSPSPSPAPSPGPSPSPTPTSPPPTTTEPPPTRSEPPPTATEPPPTSTEPPPTITEPPPTTSEPPPTSTEPPPTGSTGPAPSGPS